METEHVALKLKSRHKNDLETVEIDMLLEAIYLHYGYDFREYARASLKRRILQSMQQERVETISGLQERVLHDPVCMERFLLTLSIHVTSLFRDPEFFLLFRRQVVPMLNTYPFLRIWHAGCSTGEEVYSMAILLEEEGLYDRCRIYATDMNDAVLQKAREGIFPVQIAAQGAANYTKAGGMRSLSEYYTSAYGNAIFRASLRDNLVFSQHNLALDGSFNEFHVILCRNVMIYFAKPLQQRVHHLLYDSLARFGILGLGSKENIQFTPHESDYEQLSSGYKLYRRIR
ncbi:MAG TPA: protein-glutamate O-methyltransferase CheR [Chthonomonadaceae bacterium]|nr:protein-glutamate O-methyltransferase CheR [Chthonomonadaceae bacterium]